MSGNSYDRQPYDTERSWKAFQDYLRMPPGRTLEGLHARYMPATCPPTKSIETLRGWCKRHKWHDRADDHDADAGKLAIANAAIEREEENRKKLGEFNTISYESGRNGVILCAALKQSIRRFARGSKGMPAPNDGEAQIRTWEDASRAARIISLLETSSFDMYGQALGVDKILPLIEDDSDAQSE